MAEAIDGTLPMAEAAYQRIRGDIIACRLQPGQRITERALAKDTGFGVSPIRDALTRLDHDGLVRTIPRKGYQVAPLTLKAVDDLFGVWQVIGPEVMKRGVIAATDEQLDRIIKDLENLEEEAPLGRTTADFARFAQIGDDLFTTLAEASGNSYLAATYAKLSGEIFRVWTLIADAGAASITPATVSDLPKWSVVIRRRDGDALARHAHGYIQTCHEHVAQILVRWPSVRTSEVQPLDSE